MWHLGRENILHSHDSKFFALASLATMAGKFLTRMYWQIYLVSYCNFFNRPTIILFDIFKPDKDIEVVPDIQLPKSQHKETPFGSRTEENL